MMSRGTVADVVSRWQNRGSRNNELVSYIQSLHRLSDIRQSWHRRCNCRCNCKQPLENAFPLLHIYFILGAIVMTVAVHMQFLARIERNLFHLSLCNEAERNLCMFISLLVAWDASDISVIFTCSCSSAILSSRFSCFVVVSSSLV